VDISGVEQLLFSIHAMGAAILKTPELAIQPAEAKALATAVAGVSRHYDVAIAAKTMDWINLFTALGMVYGPRLIVISGKARDKRPQRPAPQRAEQSQPAPETSATQGFDIPGVGRVVNGEIIN
jgi:hypothetical protein